jgi:protein arginine kinase activator
MLCEECKKEPATVHLTKVINNQKYEKNLCQQCAKEDGESDFPFEPKYSINNLLAGLLNFEPSAGARPQKAPCGIPMCENCHMSYAEFSRNGRLGCSVCYTYFMQPLEPLLRRVQGRTQHAGKVPNRTGGALMVKNKIQQLRQELQRYISREEFEKAAEVRDQIKELEQELKGVE